MRRVKIVQQATDLLDFRRYKKTGRNEKGKGDCAEGVELKKSWKQNVSEGEKALKNLAADKVGNRSGQWTVDEIKSIVTVKNLCSCSDPISTAFKVNSNLRVLAKSYIENTETLNNLADQTEDFAVQLIDQVNGSEQLALQDVPGNVDRCASMLSGMTDKAIEYSQKKFVAHPLLYKRLQMRWNLGIPKVLKPREKFRPFLCLLILIDTILTPFLLPIIGYAFYHDQKERRVRSQEQRGKSRTGVKRSRLSIIDSYLNYLTSPFVLFIKDKLTQVVFIAFHCIVCTSDSQIAITYEEYIIFFFFCGMILSEFQQYKRSQLKYFKDMWNYVDVLTLFIYILIVLTRIATIIRGGETYDNDLLETANILYGVNTMLLVLRFSSILEVNSFVGPLQLALFRMILDLLTILMQFAFVVAAFSLAITKVFKADLSKLGYGANDTSGETYLAPYCDQVGALECLYKTSGHLIWSVFGLTDLDKLNTNDSLAFLVTRGLYLVFLILTVIMLINMLVALLSKTYDNITNNAEVEWKFSRAVVESQYRNLHSIVVPFNLLSVPVALIYIRLHGNPREEDAKDRRKQYKNFYRERLFPLLTKRYLEKYGGAFPLSVDDKIDLIMQNLKISPLNEENNTRSVGEGDLDNFPVPENSQMPTSSTKFTKFTAPINDV